MLSIFVVHAIESLIRKHSMLHIQDKHKTLSIDALRRGAAPAVADYPMACDLPLSLNTVCE
jgi:hypothetical protein